MSMLARFTATSAVTTQQYDQVLQQLQESGDWLPEGLDYHVAFNSGGNFRVSEIWDSQTQFEEFGSRLMPVLAKAGIELSGEPELVEIHNIEKR